MELSLSRPRRAWLLCVVLLVATSLAEETSRSIEMDRELESLFAAVTNRTPGASVLVSQRGKIVFRKTVGLARIATETPITSATRFRIGSLTKPFTSAAILKLAEEGRLTLEDRVSRYFPDWPRGGEITLRHLLQHSSGLHDFTRAPGFAAGVLQPIGREDLIRSFRDAPREFAPGHQFRYNNSGYILLGAVIERVTGLAAAEYFRRTFFVPLGMTRTEIVPASVADPDEAVGYAFERGAYREAPRWQPSWLGEAGALSSTPDDLLRWSEALFGGKVLSPESLKVAFTIGTLAGDAPSHPEDTGYGCGWIIDRLRGEREISHGGELAGFGSYLLRLPKHALTVVVLLNCVPQMPSLHQWNLARDLAGRCLRLPPPPQPASHAISPADLALIQGRYDLGDGGRMDVTVDEGRAYFALPGRDRQEMRPISDRRFEVGRGQAEAAFVRRPDGTVVKAILKQAGQRIDAPRITTASGTAER